MLQGREAVRVLVVDDTEHVAAVVADVLRLDGFDVVGCAADGEQALLLAARTDPHVVVLDLQMPGIDGLETTRRLRAQRPGQLVVLWTAYVDAQVERQAHQAGAAACLSKVDGLPRLGRELSRLALGAAPLA